MSANTNAPAAGNGSGRTSGTEKDTTILQNQDSFVRRLIANQTDSGDYPDTWRPAPGEYLAGELVRVVEAPNAATGELVGVAHIRDGHTGELLAVWLTHQLLREKWHAVAPQPGEHVGIIYKGQRTSGSGRTYKLYSVQVDRTPEQDQVRDRLDEIAALIGADLSRAARTLAWLRSDAAAGEVDHGIF